LGFNGCKDTSFLNKNANLAAFSPRDCESSPGAYGSGAVLPEQDRIVLTLLAAPFVVANPREKASAGLSGIGPA